MDHQLKKRRILEISLCKPDLEKSIERLHLDKSRIVLILLQYVSFCFNRCFWNLFKIETKLIIQRNLPSFSLTGGNTFKYFVEPDCCLIPEKEYFQELLPNR